MRPVAAAHARAAVPAAASADADEDTGKQHKAAGVRDPAPPETAEESVSAASFDDDHADETQDG